MNSKGNFKNWSDVTKDENSFPKLPQRNRFASTPNFGQIYGKNNNKRKSFEQSLTKEGCVDRFTQTDFDETARAWQGTDSLLSKSVQLNVDLLKSTYSLVRDSGIKAFNDINYKNMDELKEAAGIENFVEIEKLAREKNSKIIKDLSDKFTNAREENSKIMTDLSDQFLKLDMKYDKMEHSRKEQVKSLICLLEMVLEDHGKHIAGNLKRLIERNINRFKETVTINEEETSSSSYATESDSQSDIDLKVVIDGRENEKEDLPVNELELDSRDE